MFLLTQFMFFVLFMFLFVFFMFLFALFTLFFTSFMFLFCVSLRLDHLFGLAVKASASRAQDPGFESRLSQDISGVKSYRGV